MMTRLLPYLIAALICVFLIGCGKNPRYQGQTVDHWRQRLHDKDPSTQIQAARALSALAPESRQALDALRQTADQPVPNGVALITARTLWQQGNQNDKDTASRFFEMMVADDNLRPLVRPMLDNTMTQRWLREFRYGSETEQYAAEEALVAAGDAAWPVLKNAAASNPGGQADLQLLKARNMIENPDPSIRTQGRDLLHKIAEQSAQRLPPQVIGRWRNEFLGFKGTETIYRHAGQTFLSQHLDDGTEKKLQIHEDLNAPDRQFFEYISPTSGRPSGRRWIITDQGKLETWGQSGMLSRSDPIPKDTAVPP